MILALFGGGLNTRVAPHLIQPDQAVEYQNINNAKGILSSVKDKTETSIANAKRYGFFFDAEDEWQFSDAPTSWVEFQERLYWTDGVSTKKRFNGVTENLGISAPVGIVNLSADSAPYENTRADLTTAGGGNLPLDRSFSYKFVHRNLFSAGSDIVVETKKSTGLGKVDITNVDSNFVDSTDVYRHFDGFYRFVGNMPTALTVLVDSVYDISGAAELEVASKVDGTIQYAITFYNSVDGTESAPLLTDEIVVRHGEVTLTNIPTSADTQVTGRRLYRIGGNVTVFTRVTTIEDNITNAYVDNLGDTELQGSVLTATDNLAPPSALEFLTEHNSMLFGAVADKLYFTPIAQPNAWPAFQFLDFPSPITGIGVSSGGLLVFMKTTTWLVTGTGPTSLAQQILSGDQGCISHYSIASRKQFSIWASTDGICTSDGGSVDLVTKERLDKISFDPINAKIFDQEYYLHLADGRTFISDFARKIFKYIKADIQSIAVANDIIYGFANDKLHTLFSSSALLELTYLSPVLTAGTYTKKKAYKNIYASLNGTFTLAILIDGISAISRVFTGNDIFQIKVPSEQTTGRDIQISLVGAGEVRELNVIEGSING